MARWAGLVAALAAAACQFAKPIDVPPDAPPVDAPVDARPDLVTGTVSIGYRTEAGVTERYTDLSSVAIAALVPDAAEPSGFRTIVGTGTADGRFTIEGVPPDGEYYLKVGTTYFWTAAHVVSIRTEFPSRGDAVEALSPTPVTMPAPPTPGGAVLYTTELMSLRAGVYLQFTDLTPPDYSGDWSSSAFGLHEPNRRWLPSEAAGDDLWALQYRRSVVRLGWERAELAAARHYDDATITDGQGRSFDLPLQPVGTMRPISVSFGSLGAYTSAYDARSETYFSRLSVHAMPALAARWTAASWNEYSAPLVDEVVGGVHADVAVPRLSGQAPDPFPDDWPRVIVQRLARRYWYRRPGSPTAPLSFFDGGLTRIVQYPFTQPLTSGLLSPPSALRLAGHDAMGGGGLRSVGLAPIPLEWAPSAGARQYAVTIYRLGTSGLRSGPVLHTTSPGLSIPIEALAGAEFFVFAVAAFSASNDLTSGALYPVGVPGAMAVAATGPFRITASCGNGAIDPGETCDGAGTESASCDLDCTARECGDGVRNATAGEVCDAIVDTAGCDADCTAVACGDGYLNAEAEQCDDGNAVDDGNGCSADCRFNRCGDGVVQPYGQECDTAGASATCDADCTLVVCGDYVINAAAGETCDDGSASSGDGCSATCRLE